MAPKKIRGNTRISPHQTPQTEPLSESSEETFGYQIDQAKKADLDNESFVAPVKDGGEIILDAGNAYGTYLDIVGTIANDYDLITRYREMLLQPEVESAVDDIVNESIVVEEDEYPVIINLDKVKVSKTIKDKIKDEFEIVCQLLDIKERGYEVFKKWYVDGRLFYHLIIDEKKKADGIQEARYIDPRQITKVVEVERTRDSKTGIELIKKNDEYFVYNPAGIRTQQFGFPQTQQVNGIKISGDVVAYSHSGIVDTHNKTVYSHLHKAIKVLNQLRMIEDAVVIYRITRAPERRIFYVDVGNLPRNKAEEYLRKVMTKYKNKIFYDASTGEVKDDRRHLAMLEDFWMPRREGSTGTEIDTLPGGENLGEMEDVEYFQKKLYRSLNVPFSRWSQPENGFNMGKAAEITRDELKFTKFILRLRRRFANIFDQILGRQLILKNVVRNEDEWNTIKNNIYYEFASDSYFAESKENEILQDRLDLLNNINEYVGVYYSKNWVSRKILRQSDEEIKEMKAEIKKEDAGEYEDDLEIQVARGFSPNNQDDGDQDQDKYNGDTVTKEPEDEDNSNSKEGEDNE